MSVLEQLFFVINMNKTQHDYNLQRKSTKPSMNKSKIHPKQSLNKSKTLIKLSSLKDTIHPPSPQNYILENLIGEGSFAKVYKARRKIDGNHCVIKLIEKSTLNTSERRNAFKRQLQALSLPKHPNLVNSIDQFENQHYMGIVMEYFSSTSLSDLVKKQCQPLENSVLQKIAQQVCQGLIYLHSYGFSHRDIKPQNILINPDYNIKIIDFGFATTQQLNQVVIAGTPKFMAPELLVKKNYDPLKADVWAFGIMMYWVAMGYYPQDADTKKRKIQNNKIDELHLHFPVDINPGLEYLLRKMLNPNPKQRIELKNIMEDTWLKPKLFKIQIDKLRQFKNKYVTLVPSLP